MMRMLRRLLLIEGFVKGDGFEIMWRYEVHSE